MTEEASITASFVLTLDEVKAARSSYSARPRSTQIIVAAIFIAGLGLIVAGLLTGRLRVDIESFDAGTVLLFIGGALLIYALFRSQSGAALQRAFVQDPAGNRRVDLRFSQDGIVSKVEGLSETTFQWNGILRVRRTAQGFLFYKGPRTCLWVPEHAFASRADADKVAVLARARVSGYSEG